MLIPPTTGLNPVLPARIYILYGILNDQRRIGAIITEHTKLSQEEVATLFTEASTKDARYAIDKGIVHALIIPHFYLFA